MAKSTPALRGSPTEAIPRFVGKSGKRRQIESLRSQTLISHDAALAHAFAKAGQLHEFKKGEALTRQGDPDNDILMLLHGAVSVLVNEREVATRVAGTHVGELALVDHLATRSGTVVAIEPTIALRVPEHKFSRIANKNPDLWRRICEEARSSLIAHDPSRRRMIETTSTWRPRKIDV